MPKKLLQIFFLYSLLTITPITFASTPKQIQSNIDRILKKYNRNINVGIIAHSLTRNATLYQKNANQLFIPASILKIFPAAAALSFLGPEYRFQTKVLTTNIKLDRGILNDNLYLYFDGDPSLTNQHIDGLIKNLVALGITTINGNIYIDDSIFDDALLCPGWMWDDLNACYAAPISAIMINKNCFGMRLVASKISGHPATLIEKNNHMLVKNYVVSKKPETTRCAINLRALNNNNYHLSGCLKTNSAPIDLFTSVRNARLYAKSLLLEELQLNNIKLLGKIEFRKISDHTKLSVLTEHHSPPLSELIKIMLKKSDNTVADVIYKKLGATFYNKQASWQDGAKAIKAILEAKTKIDFRNMLLDDGSGLSRYNLVTPLQLIKVLNYAYRDEAVKQAFIYSLPKSGVDGTLQYRMPNLKNRVYAKTGNMGNSSSLAGYIRTKTQGTVAFVILVNSFIGSPKKYHKLQDEICMVLANS